jgi:putative chitinase
MNGLNTGLGENNMSFDFDFNIDKLAQCVENPNIEEWWIALEDALPQHGITTVERVAGFIAQCQHESNDFKVLQENLNYSWQGLRKTFPKYFRTDADAMPYHRQPEKIANRVYANRMHNGPESSGDGWAFRGRGIIQITGRENYTNCSEAILQDDSFIQDPDLLRTPGYAVLSACWYWSKTNLNETCDNRDIVTMTKRINGGTIGLAERTKNWENALLILGN